MKTIEIYETVEDLIQAIKRGEIIESALSIEVDNDGVLFGYGEYNENTCEYAFNINIKNAEGYRDVAMLYSLLFPRANVGWV